MSEDAGCEYPCGMEPGGCANCPNGDGVIVDDANLVNNLVTGFVCLECGHEFNTWEACPECGCEEMECIN